MTLTDHGDRDLQRLGFKVFRYSGSDLWRDTLAAADEVLETLVDAAGKKW